MFRNFFKNTVHIIRAGKMCSKYGSWLMLGATLVMVTPATAVPFHFSTGDPDGRIATGSRPSNTGKIEIESADDFITPTSVLINNATFTGLLTGSISLADIGAVRVEIYRVFSKDSIDPPSGNVPTRVNSPSDVAFDERDTASGSLSFTTTDLGSFTVANSVLNGIHKIPNQTTGGEGSVTGQAVQFNISFTTPFSLPADHYFFIPQVEVADPNGEFLWLSASKPILAPGTSFTPDLQSWIRNEDLAPDWLRIGTDIIGGSPAPTFNAVFSLDGITVPEPSTIALLLGGLSFLPWASRQRLSQRIG